MDTLIKLVLVFFLALLSFSIGTFVGKSFSDSQHKMAELENNGGNTDDRGTASIPADAAKVEPGQAIPSEEEISKLTDEFVKKEKNEPAVEGGAAKKEEMKGDVVGEDKKEGKKPKAEAKKLTVHDEIANVAKKIASGEKLTAPKPVVSRIPSSMPKEQAATTIGKYTVQVSSHNNEDDAKKGAEALKEKGFSAFYVNADVNGKTWYRVVVGLFENRTAANEYKGKLMKEAGLSSAIVQKIAKDQARTPANQ